MKAAPVLLVLLLAAGPAAAEEIRCAVAANFAPCFEEIAAAFEDSTGRTVLVSVGSTGSLSTQIRQGAPFDVFFAADVEHPRRLEEEGRTRPGTRVTFAVGRLVLWTRVLPPGGIPGLAAVLTDSRITHLAVADPRLAPYGRAARQTLDALGIDPGDRLVLGRNVAQTWHFVASGAAEAGFVAQSQIPAGGPPSGMVIPVPEGLYEPILQQMVILSGAPEDAADLLDFVLAGPGRDHLAAYGYAVESRP